MFSCAVCDERIFTAALCPECVKVRHAMTLYGKERVWETINTIFIRGDAGIKKQETAILTATAVEAKQKAIRQ